MDEEVLAAETACFKRDLLQNINQYIDSPFKNHPSLPAIVDILSRKDEHHLVLITEWAEKVVAAFLAALAQVLTIEKPPTSLHKLNFFYLNLQHASLSVKRRKEIDAHAQEILTLQKKEKCVVLALNKMDWLNNETLPLTSAYNKLLQQLLTPGEGRLIVLTNKADYQKFIQHGDLPFGFTTLALPEATEAESIAILKTFRAEWEEYHQIIIPEEMMAAAYYFSQRYLSHTHALNKALLLLDSAAARCSQFEPTETQPQAILSLTELTQVLSSWTGISSSQFQQHKFKIGEFTQGMQQRLFGQDTAMLGLGHALQQAYLGLQDKSGPFAGFLFVGPSHVGKKTAGYQIAEQLFKQREICFYANLHHTANIKSFTDLKVRAAADQHYYPITEAIKNTPFAILFLDNIQGTSAEILQSLEEIFSSGHLIDHQGHAIDFQQTTIILATNLASERIIELTQPTQVEESESLGLMQLILSDHLRDPLIPNRPFTAEEITEEILPLLTLKLPSSLLHYLTIVPFLPLDRVAAEKIIRIKLRHLAKRLEKQFGIEFGYAPEVIRFLVQETSKINKSQSIEKMLEQRVYPVVSQVLLAKVDEKNRPSNLFLQLNDTGQLLRCDWASARENAS